MKKFNIADWQKKHLLNESRLNEVDSETTVKYTDDNGKDHEIKYGSAMKYDDSHPAKVAALSMTDSDGGGDKEAGQEKEPTGKLSGADFERGSSDDSKSKPEFDKDAKRAAIKSSKEVAKTLEKTKDLKATIDQSAKSLESLSNNSYEAKDASKIMDTVLGMAKSDPIIFTEPEVSMKAVKTVFDKFVEEHGEDGEKELVRGIMSSHKRSPFLYALDDDMFKKYPKLETRKKNASDMIDYMNMNGMAAIAYHADFKNPKDPIIQHYGDKENLRTSAGTHTNKWDSFSGKGNPLLRSESKTDFATMFETFSKKNK